MNFWRLLWEAGIVVARGLVDSWRLAAHSSLFFLLFFFLFLGESPIYLTLLLECPIEGRQNPEVMGKLLQEEMPLNHPSVSREEALKILDLRSRSPSKKEIEEVQHKQRVIIID
jgi:hypothetical protein